MQDFFNQAGAFIYSNSSAPGISAYTIVFFTVLLHQMQKHGILLLLIAILLSAFTAVGNQACTHSSLSKSSCFGSPHRFTAHQQREDFVPENICAAARPGLTSFSGSQYTRPFPADAGPAGAYSAAVHLFIPFLTVENFGNNQRNYNHPTHQFW